MPPRTVIIDGTSYKDVPENVTDDEIRQVHERSLEVDPSAGRRAMAEGGYAKPNSAGAVFARSTINSLLNGLLQVPAFFAEMAIPLSPFSIPQSAVEWEYAEQRRHELAQKLAPIDANDLRAGVDVMGQLLAGDIEMGNALTEVPDAFRQAVGEQQDRDLFGASLHPLAERVGEYAGGAAQLLSFRLPIVNIARRESRRVAAISKEKPSTTRTPVPPGIRGLVDDIVNNRLVTMAGKSGLRVGEAGLEGAVLAALNEGDPLMTMAFAAGGQAAGGVVLGGSTALLKRPALLLSVAAGALVVQMIRQTIPGGNDWISESAEFAIDKVNLMFGLGLVAAVAGVGRAGLPPVRLASLTRNLPKLADSIFTAPRGMWVSLVSDLTKAEESGDTIPLMVLEKFIENADYFGPAARDHLAHAIRSESVSFNVQVQALMQNELFHSRLVALSNSSVFTGPKPSVNGPTPVPAPAPAPATALAPPTGP